jgi:nucleotide-binding universal stress UspA family protein
MTQKRILVPLDGAAKDLKSVHYAISLAERLNAQVYILQETHTLGPTIPHSAWLEEALVDLINIARQAGLTVSHYIADGELKEEIIELVKANGIDLVVIGGEDGGYKCLFDQLKPMITPKVIQVKEKDTISYL